MTRLVGADFVESKFTFLRDLVAGLFVSLVLLGILLEFFCDAHLVHHSCVTLTIVAEFVAHVLRRTSFAPFDMAIRKFNVVE